MISLLVLLTTISVIPRSGAVDTLVLGIVPHRAVARLGLAGRLALERV